MKNLILYISLALIIGSCQSDHASCLQGKILKYNCCLGATSISISTFVPLSKTITEGNKTYHNVIIVPGYVGTDGTDLFLRVRKYQAEKDSNLLDGMCLCAIAKGDDPTYVITASSGMTCP
jgi:hypothetical protein